MGEGGKTQKQVCCSCQAYQGCCTD